MSSPEVCGPAQGLTRIRLQPAIYFCLHRGSLPENTAGRQPRLGAKNPRPQDFVKNCISAKPAAPLCNVHITATLLGAKNPNCSFGIRESRRRSRPSHQGAALHQTQCDAPTGVLVMAASSAPRSASYPLAALVKACPCRVIYEL